MAALWALLAASLAVARGFDCGALEEDALRPVASVDIDLTRPFEAEVLRETCVRWPHESARDAARRFCAENHIDDAYHSAGFRSAATDGDACARTLAERLSPEIAAAPPGSWAARVGGAYEEATQLSLGAQMAMAAAIRVAGPAPHALSFGCGFDSVLLCAAATLGRRGSMIFVEEDLEWAGVVRARLAAFLAANGLPPGACAVRTIATATRRAHWVDWLGRDGALANGTIAQIFPGAGAAPAFDVVIVDGPCGCNDLCAGRMAAIATAARVAKRETGVVFVDDLDRTVERVWANALLRPAFRHEILVANTIVNHLKYFTNDGRFACVAPPSKARVTDLADSFGLESVFRPDSPDATELGLGDAGAEGWDPAAAKARLRAILAASPGPAG